MFSGANLSSISSSTSYDYLFSKPECVSAIKGESNSNDNASYQAQDQVKAQVNATTILGKRYIRSSIEDDAGVSLKPAKLLKNSPKQLAESRMFKPLQRSIVSKADLCIAFYNLELENYEKAKMHALKALSINDTPDIFCALAAIHFKMNDIEGAKNYVIQAVARNDKPFNALIKYNIPSLVLLEKTQILFRALKNQEYPDFLVLIAKIKFDLGELKAADNLCTEAIKILASKRKTCLNQILLAANIKYFLKDYQKADEYCTQILNTPSYQKMLNFKENDLGIFLAFVGKIKFQLNSIQLADYYYNEALKILKNKATASTLASAGAVKTRLGFYHAADSLLKKALRKSGSMPRHWIIIEDSLVETHLKIRNQK